MENCSKANEKRCTMPYSMSLYNVGVVTLFISAIINVTNQSDSIVRLIFVQINVFKYIYLKVKSNIIIY